MRRWRRGRRPFPPGTRRQQRPQGEVAGPAAASGPLWVVPRQQQRHRQERSSGGSMGGGVHGSGSISRSRSAYGAREIIRWVNGGERVGERKEQGAAAVGGGGGGSGGGGGRPSSSHRPPLGSGKRSPPPLPRPHSIIERAPSGPPPQPPLQPGSTPAPDASVGGVNRGCRYLAYNTLGFVSAGPGIDEDCASVEVSVDCVNMHLHGG